jgi:hypothetical protein
MMDNKAILHVSDWNLQDRYYEAPLALIKEMQSKIRKIGMEKAWTWWTNQVDWDQDSSQPIKYGIVNMTLDTFFLDYNNELESIDEWEF